MDDIKKLLLFFYKKKKSKLNLNIFLRHEENDDRWRNCGGGIVYAALERSRPVIHMFVVSPSTPKSLSIIGIT